MTRTGKQDDVVAQIACRGDQPRITAVAALFVAPRVCASALLDISLQRGGDAAAMET